MKVISDGMMSADNILEESLTVIDLSLIHI